jgi:serine/threonine protein kinase
VPDPLQDGDPERFGQYRLLGRLGRGGMGTVYLGVDEQGRRVAVKVINRELSGTPEFHERFRREVEAARRVRRFCTAPILDAALGDPPWYVVTEYVDGPTLQEVVDGSGPLQGADLEGLAVGIATALSAIHDADLVHRDLKPSNVLLSPVGPRVIDFGIARALDEQTGMTRTGQIVGTPAYLAPELVTGGSVTPAADVFSWACVIAFAGTGRGPFEGRTVPEILHRVAYEPPRLDGLDPTVMPVVQRALAKDPDQRPTVPELLDGLAGRPAPSEPVRSPAPTKDITWPGAPSQPVPAGRPPWPAGPPPISTHPPYPPPTFPPQYRPPHYGGPLRKRRSPLRIILPIALIVVLALAVRANRSPSTDGDNADRASTGTEKRTSSTPSQRGRSEVDARFRGTWRGQIYQQDSSDSPYPAVFTITSGKRGDIVGKSVYPTLECSGDLELITASSTALTVREKITKGAMKCITVTITLTRRSTGALAYSYSGGVGHGTLSKSKG